MIMTFFRKMKLPATGNFKCVINQLFVIIAQKYIANHDFIWHVFGKQAAKLMFISIIFRGNL